MQFNNDPLVSDKNNYSIKIVNAYIVYNLDYWTRKLLNNFVLRNCLFVGTNIINNSDKSRYVYSGYSI